MVPIGKLTTADSPIVDIRTSWPVGTGMVYFGMSPWAGMWKSRHQLMSRFSRFMPVLYVEPWVGLRSLRRNRSMLSTLAGDLRSPILDKDEHGVTVFYSPSYLPVSRSELFKGVTQHFWASAVRRCAIAIGITRPIVWISRPEMGFLIGKLDEQLCIYHAVDEYAGYTGLSPRARQRLCEAENHVLNSVDLSIVASPELEASKAGPGRDILVVENGVENREYERALALVKEPNDLEKIPKPRIGYSGLIGKRLSFHLIKGVAQSRPDWSIVMIGKVDRRECESDIAELLAIPNVYFLGQKPHTEVANYIAGLDVGLMPYEINLETQHISPIKMYEYWAGGKPVVSTAIPAALRHDFAVNIARSCDEAVTTIDRLLSTIDAEKSNYLCGLAKQNSWDARVNQIWRELGARLKSNAAAEPNGFQ